MVLSALDSHADANSIDPLNETKSRYEEARASKAYSLFNNAVFSLTNTSGADVLKTYEYRCDFGLDFYECNRVGNYTRLFKNSDGLGILTQENDKEKKYAFAGSVDYYLEMTKVDILYHSRHALDWILDKFENNNVRSSRNAETGIVRFDVCGYETLFEFEGPLLRLYAKYSGEKFSPNQTVSEIQRFRYNLESVGNVNYTIDGSYEQFELPEDYVFEGGCLNFAWQVVRPPYSGEWE